MGKVPYGKWSDEPHSRWIEAGNTFGRHLVAAARDYAFERIPEKATPAVRRAAEKAALGAIYGMMMLLDGVADSTIDESHRVNYVLLAQVTRGGKTMKYQEAGTRRNSWGHVEIYQVTIGKRTIFIVAALRRAFRSIFSCFVRYSVVLQTLLFVALFPHAASAGVQVNVKLRPHREPVLVLPTEEKLNEKINAAVAVDFSNTSLEDALKYVEALEGLKFEYDPDAKDGKKFSQGVTLAVKDFPLRVLLKMLLEPVALDWVIRDEKLIITTHEAAAEQLRAWKYDISDLTAAGIPVADLAATIMAVVALRAWQPFGGNGTLEFDDGSIIVRQTRQVHRKVYCLLRDIRQHLSETKEETLARNGRFLTKRYNVEDLIEPGATEEQVVSDITSEICQLTWKESGGRGTIALIGKTLDVANEQWVHDRLGRLLELVGSLGLERGRNGSIFNLQYGNLKKAMELAQVMNLEGAWPLLPAMLGGKTSAAFETCPLLNAMTFLSRTRGFTVGVSTDVLKSGGKNVMSVSLVLKDVSFRTILDRTLAPFSLDWYLDDPTRMIVASPVVATAHRKARVYRIRELVGPDRDAAGLVKSITATIEPESWTPPAASATIRVLPGLLVISHNRRTHERITEFLESIEKLHEQ